jgi:hypothetical protein
VASGEARCLLIKAIRGKPRHRPRIGIRTGRRGRRARLRNRRSNGNLGREQAVSIISNLFTAEDTCVPDEEEIGDISGKTLEKRLDD